MTVIVNFISEKSNVINTFLTKYFEKDMMTDENTTEWSYTLQNPLDAVNIVSAVMDSDFSSYIDFWISFDTNIFIKVREDNYNDIIKYIIYRVKQAS